MTLEKHKNRSWGSRVCKFKFWTLAGSLFHRFPPYTQTKHDQSELENSSDWSCFCSKVYILHYLVHMRVIWSKIKTQKT